MGLIGHRGAVRATDRRCAGCGRTAGGLTPRACVMRVCIPETPQIAHLRTPGAVAQSAAPVARPPDARPTASTEIVWVAESGRAARRVDGIWRASARLQLYRRTGAGVGAAPALELASVLGVNVRRDSPSKECPPLLCGVT